MESRTARTDRSPLARPAARRRVPLARGRRRHPDHSADARTGQHPATQRYLNVTDEEMRRGLEVSWKNEGRPLRLASGSGSALFWFRIVPVLSLGTGKFWLRGRATR